MVGGGAPAGHGDEAAAGVRRHARHPRARATATATTNTATSMAITVSSSRFGFGDGAGTGYLSCLAKVAACFWMADCSAAVRLWKAPAFA